MSNIIPFPSPAKEEPFIKQFNSWDHDELVKAAGKMVSYIDDDFVKSATSSVLSRELLDKYYPDDDHFGIHTIIMGSGEAYGFNKNGDFWTRAGLEHKGNDYGYETFAKYGHFFREHDHDDPKKAIGKIKLAVWHPKVERVELILWGDKRKAEKEYQLAKSGKTLSFSMSARVPEDFCSICDNPAKRSKNYCVHLKKHMTQWLKKFSKFAYAINKRPRFFDASAVENPADRIAHYLDYMISRGNEMAKAAAASDQFLFSDVMAKIAGVRELPVATLGCHNFVRQQWLEKLAAVERYLQSVDLTPNDVSKDFRFQFVKNCAEFAFGPTDIKDSDLDLFRTIEPDVFWFQLAKSASMLPFDAFCAYVTKQKLSNVHQDAAFKYAKAQFLPTLFNDLLSEDADEESEKMFSPCDSIKASAYDCDALIAPAVNRVKSQCAITLDEIRPRALRFSAAGFRKNSSKNIFDSDVSCETKTKAKNLSRAYAHYKVASCEAISDIHGQDIIDDTLQILIVSQHK